MVKFNKKSSSTTEVVAGVPTPPLRSAEKDLKDAFFLVKKKKKKKIEKKAKSAKKLLASAEKSQPAKKSEKKQKSSDDSSPDISAEKDMEMVDDAPLLIYDVSWKEEPILPEDSRTLFATNLRNPPGRKIAKADFDKFFRRAGKVVDVSIKYRKEKFVDYAKIEFESHDVAKKALKSHGRMLFGSVVILDVSYESRGEERSQSAGSGKLPTACVRGFGTAIEAHKLGRKLRKHLSSCGEIHSVITPENDDNCLSKGVAYIEFKNGESLSKALEQNGIKFMGVPLQVRIATNVTVTNMSIGWGVVLT